MIAIDAHVHVYPSYRVDRFLEAAVENFSANQAMLGVGSASWVLGLTESAGCGWFEQLRDRQSTVPGWRVLPTREECSLTLSALNKAATLHVIAGHQVVTRERIEVLVIGQTEKPPDGQWAGDLVADLVSGGRAIVVLPWGFGKWFGRRGKLVKRLIDTFEREIFVGDNSGRAALLPRPRLLRYAESLGLKELSGSDPLPLPGEERTVARLTSWFDHALDPEAPFATSKAGLTRSSIIRKGSFEKPLRFAKHQYLMQMRKG